MADDYALIKDVITSTSFQWWIMVFKVKGHVWPVITYYHLPEYKIYFWVGLSVKV